MDTDVPAAVNQFSVQPPIPVRSSPSRARRPLAPVIAALVAVLCGACSFIGVKRLDPELAAGEQPDCTSSWTLPLIDMGLAVTSGSAGVLIHGAAAGREDDGKDAGGLRIAGWSALGATALFIASGAYGTYQRNRCAGAEAAYALSVQPSYIQESQPLKGAAGAPCQNDTDCGEDLLCGEPMKTCIPANPPEESPSP
jgi:hypothetical protein